jgi:hypothetical protein
LGVERAEERAAVENRQNSHSREHNRAWRDEEQLR